MDLFDVLTLIGGLSLFLFGMSIMGQALERADTEKQQQNTRSNGGQSILQRGKEERHGNDSAWLCNPDVRHGHHVLSRKRSSLIAWRRVIRPEFTKPTTMTVVADELWIMAVTPHPVRNPAARPEVIFIPKRLAAQGWGFPL